MSTPRFLGLDVHKRHVVIAAVNAHQEVILKPKKITVPRFEAWAQQHLHPDDQIALEATSNSWTFHDLLQPLVAKVAVANSFKLKVISASTKKTDKHDALLLAKLLAARLLPTVWVPPPDVRELRALMRHRTQLVQKGNSAKNQLHALLHQHNLSLPEGGPFTQANETWWATLPLSTTEKLQIRHFWQHLHYFKGLIAETEAFIAQLSVSAPWAKTMPFLVQLPGIGLYNGMTILAAIGDIQRFPSAKHLVGYAGLGAKVEASGETYHTGPISKKGRRELRTALVAAAWIAVRFSDHWRQQFEPLATRIGKFKAITAIARKLLVVIWQVLTKQEADRHADPEAVARSFMTWSSQHHLAHSQGIGRLEFVRQRLEQVGLLSRVLSFRANGRLHYFPSPS